MTLREEYLQSRKKNEIDFNFLYKYYINKVDKNPASFTIFMQAIQFCNIETIVEVLDVEFDVTRVYDAKGILMTAF